MTDNTKATAERESLTDWAWRLYGMLQSQGRISLHVMHEFATRIQIKGEEYKKVKAALEEHHRVALEYNGDAYAESALRAQTEEALKI